MIMPRAAAARLRRHWLLAVLLAAGLALRIATQLAYRPALLYIDSYKYLYRAGGNDPVGYRALLRPVLAVANLDTVAALQHLLGLAMAVALYALVVRRGASRGAPSTRWLAALAAAPVLLDGYQLQMEQTVMPDVLFEALMVAGLLVLLWRPMPALWQVALAGLLLGATATVAQVGEIFILPAVVYAAIVTDGWRRRLGHGAAICLAFAVPILAYDTAAYAVAGRFSLANAGITTFYGRLASAADCRTLKLPADERALCPSRALAARLGIDGLEHASDSPLRPYYRKLPSHTATRLVSSFNRGVLQQQPLRVAGSVARDAIKVFAVQRVTSPGDTPISRWQFHTVYPLFPPYVAVRGGVLAIGEYSASGRRVVVLGTSRDIGGGPVVDASAARFLRGYQLDGGYTPGPLLLGLLLAAVTGSAFLLRRRAATSPAARGAARACGLLLAVALLVVLASDATEFSWRYQLPAIVTLPPAGVLGVTVIIGYVRQRRADGRERLIRS
ncbi:MAG TPA: hypothetical protein VGL63_12660 [Streptosporangiaceae bacterium]